MLRLLAIAAALGWAGSAPAQLVESSYTVQLTGKRTTHGALGDRPLVVRIGTKDLIQQFAHKLAPGATPGRSLRLVVRRSTGDLAFRDAQEFLVIDGVYHAIGGTAEIIEMPRSFHGHSASSRRRPGGPDLSFGEEAVGMFRMGSGASGRGEFVFSALARRSARLLVHQGLELGYVHTSLTWDVSGGLVDDQGELMPVRGRLMLGPEKLVP